MKKIQRRIAIVAGALGLALALIFGIAAFNAPAASAQTATPSATAAPKTGTTTQQGKHAKNKRGRLHVVATVSAINGQQLSLTWRGWSRTVTVDSSVKITEGGKTITFADIHVGDQVVLHFTKGTNGQQTLSAVRVIQPHVGGTVSAVNGTSFTVQHKAGKSGQTSSITVNTTSSTVFTKGKNGSASLSDVTVNSRVIVVGTKNADGSLTATHVYIGKAKATK